MTGVRPGVVILNETTPVPRGIPTDTGVAYMTGLSERGPVGTTVLLDSLSDYVRLYGSRVTYGQLYDAAEIYFRLGGRKLYLSRVVGPAPVKATKTLNDRAGTPLPTIRVDAVSAGEWGNTLTVSIANGVTVNTFIITIKRSTVVVEVSPELANPAAAVAWSLFSSYVRVTDLASASVAPTNNPAVVADQALISGTDNRASITETQWTDALVAFPRILGPGQVLAPGRTTGAAHEALLVHAEVNNRAAPLDLADTAATGTLIGAVAADRVSAGTPEYGAAFAPWLLARGVLGGTTRTIPPSVAVAAAAGRSDAVFGTANIAPAGANGQLRSPILGLTRTYTDTDRELLNESGVNVIRDVFGATQIYGFRSEANPTTDPEFLQFTATRFRMQLAAQAERIGERFVFRQIDGRGQLFAEFRGVLDAMLLRHYIAGSLFGATPEDAFFVDVGSGVNTSVTIADGQLRARISVRMSPFAELVEITIVKELLEGQAA